MAHTATDPRFHDLIAPNAPVREIGSGFIFTEGPLWHPVEQHLIFSDMPGDVRRRWSEAQGITEIMRPSHKGNGMTYDADLNLLVCEHSTSSVTRFTPDGFGSLNGRFENFGVMRGGIHGFDVDGTFSGEIFNCGIIEAGADGFSIATGTGTIHNHGGRIQAAGNAISLGAGNGRVVLSGPSHIIGAIDGGGGTGDVLRFQNIRGVTAEKEA
ncbi:MAG: SMP-30/gluconolactonase/LRE family protein, partial [Pseudomonadota bacterium]